MRAAGRGAGKDRLDGRRAGRRGRIGAARRSKRGFPKERTKFFANSTGGGGFCRRIYRGGRLAAAERFARREDGKNSGGDRCSAPRVEAAMGKHRRSRAEKGSAEMLYWLFVFVLRPHFSPLNVFRYITVRTAVASLTALLLSLAAGAVGDRAAARIAGEAVHPRGGAEGASEESGNADDGRRADRGVDRDSDAAVGGSAQRVRDAGDGCDAGVSARSASSTITTKSCESGIWG